MKCNQPIDCFNCPYGDCINSKPATRSETAYLKAAKMPQGRHSSSYNFLLIDDVIFKRSGRIV